MNALVRLHKHLLTIKMKAWGSRITYYAADMSSRAYELRLLAHLLLVVCVFTFIGLIAADASGLAAYAILFIGMAGYCAILFAALMCLRAAGRDIARQYEMPSKSVIHGIDRIVI